MNTNGNEAAPFVTILGEDGKAEHLPITYLHQTDTDRAEADAALAAEERARVKRGEQLFAAIVKAIRGASDEAPEVTYPKSWDDLFPKDVFTDLTDARDRYARAVVEAKADLARYEHLDNGTVVEARKLADRLRVEASAAEKEAAELQGELDMAPLHLKTDLRAIEDALQQVNAWRTNVERSLLRLTRA